MKYVVIITALTFLVLGITSFVLPEPEEEHQLATGTNIGNLERVKRGCCEYYLCDESSNS